MSGSLQDIEARQTRWANPGICDISRPTYARGVNDNLFLGRVTEVTEAEFLRADGSELRDTARRPAKMRALVSSSALAVNFFDAWRGKDTAALGHALGLDESVSDIRFEYVCSSYPVGPRSPNLDLLIRLLGGTSVAVESKFAEPYRHPGRDARLAPKYLEASPGHWAAVGLTKAQRMAEGLGAHWQYLDVAQLIKHMLGLANDRCASTLLYLWYDTGLEDAARHREELARFVDSVGGEGIAVRSRTYQEAFAVLKSSSEPVVGWREYMAARYFAV